MAKFRATAELKLYGKKYVWRSGWFDCEQEAEADLDRILQQPKYEEIPAGSYHVLVIIEKERGAA